jgi:hypothetical protein
MDETTDRREVPIDMAGAGQTAPSRRALDFEHPIEITFGSRLLAP